MDCEEPIMEKRLKALPWAKILHHLPRTCRPHGADPPQPNEFESLAALSSCKLPRKLTMAVSACLSNRDGDGAEAPRQTRGSAIGKPDSEVVHHLPVPRRQN